MKKRLQKLSYIFVCALLLLSLCACGGKSKDHYKKYVKSLISINYINSGNDYKDTGSTKQDADALYEANMNPVRQQLARPQGRLSHLPKESDTSRYAKDCPNHYLITHCPELAI